MQSSDTGLRRGSPVPVPLRFSVIPAGVYYRHMTGNADSSAVRFGLKLRAGCQFNSVCEKRNPCTGIFKAGERTPPPGRGAGGAELPAEDLAGGRLGDRRRRGPSPIFTHRPTDPIASWTPGVPTDSWGPRPVPVPVPVSVGCCAFVG